MNEDFSEIIAAVKKFAVDNLSLSTLSDEELEEQIKTITDNMIGNRYVSIKNRVDIAQQVFSSIRGFGLLDTIMNDDTITEVMINGADNIFIEQAGRVKRLDESFESQRKLEDIIQRIVGKAGREVNQSNPIVDTRLPDGSRVNVVLPPIALCGPTVTIRKFSKTPMTIEKLISYGSITREIADKLKLLVEATFIFPIVFFCMFFLIYIGMYILQSVLIYTQTQKVASIVSKSMAVTGYEKVGKHTADNVNFDFKDNKYFTQDSVNTIYDEKAKLYRYFYPDPIAGNSDIESINSSLTSLIDNLSIISGGGVTCDINAKNYFINQTVSVTIKREGAIPEVFSYIGMDGVSSDITVTATAASCDGAEFVRNTDMVYDFVTFLSDRLHISDKISYLKEKVQGVFQEDAKEAANAAG